MACAPREHSEVIFASESVYSPDDRERERPLPASHPLRVPEKQPQTQQNPTLAEHGLHAGGRRRGNCGVGEDGRAAAGERPRGGGRGRCEPAAIWGDSCTGSESSKCGGPEVITGKLGRARLPRGCVEGQVTREPVGRGPEVQPGLGPCCRAGVRGLRWVTHRRGPRQQRWSGLLWYCFSGKVLV